MNYKTIEKKGRRSKKPRGWERVNKSSYCFNKCERNLKFEKEIIPVSTEMNSLFGVRDETRFICKNCAIENVEDSN